MTDLATPATCLRCDYRHPSRGVPGAPLLDGSYSPSGNVMLSSGELECGACDGAGDVCVEHLKWDCGACDDDAATVTCEGCEGKGTIKCEHPEAHTYASRDPVGWCGDASRGAALGRSSRTGDPVGVLRVCHVPIDTGGYDVLGTYWGDGQPLYWLADLGGEVDTCFRAEHHGAAHAHARDLFPSPARLLYTVERVMPCPECEGTQHGCESERGNDCDVEGCEDCGPCYVCGGWDDD